MIWDFLFNPRKVFSLLSVVLIFGCTQKTTFTPVNINGQYSVRLPSYLEPAQLNKEASLQYQNAEKEFYFVVIDESKTELKQYNLNYTHESYFNGVKNGITKSILTDTVASAPIKKQMSDSSVLVSEIKGKADKENIFYKCAVVETKDHYYQLITWTLQDYAVKYSADMDSMLYSFKELRTGN